MEGSHSPINVQESTTLFITILTVSILRLLTLLSFKIDYLHQIQDKILIVGGTELFSNLLEKRGLALKHS